MYLPLAPVRDKNVRLPSPISPRTCKGNSELAAEDEGAVQENKTLWCSSCDHPLTGTFVHVINKH